MSIWEETNQQEQKGFEHQSEIMAVSLTIIVLIIFLHLLAFVFAIGAERRRSEVNPFFSLH
jgi:ABC-type lipoprotein release transport system permease subunit